ncbi:MAG TPA: GGDEF domain-containing protein, partial [Rhodanobacter sp.]|nr:GGDEF domain-containing protein [Rhodanobacter sp.]
AQFEQAKGTDRARAAQLLRELHREASRLTPRQRWHLRYLDAWEASLVGNYAQADAQFREIIDHSGDAVMAARASAMLLSDLGFTRQYQAAYELAGQLVARLPALTDPAARYQVLENLSQAFDYAGQIDLAVTYADMMEEARPAGEAPCQPAYMRVAALYNGKRLPPDSQPLEQATRECAAANKPLYVRALGLLRVAAYLDARQPAAASAVLARIGPEILQSGYSAQILSWRTKRAVVDLQLGRDEDARKAALAVLAMRRGNESNEWFRDAYHVLYQVEKRLGDAAAALAYHEQYVAQNQAFLDDVNARAVAYETVQQRVLAQELKAEQLDRQNIVLRMRQALEAKRVETSRLAVALLVLVLVFGAMWMLRLKRSQLRFRQLSRLDGLTGILNRQHFVAEAERALRELQRRRAVACMVFVDLDHFKRINDTYGHLAGDEVLRHVVASGCQQLRAGDLFGRLGGEEFGMLLIGCTHEQGFAIADRVRRAIEVAPVACDGVTMAVSASLGLAFTDTCGHQLQQLFRAADLALYKAKRGGRNRTMVAMPGTGPVEA